MAADPPSSVTNDVTIIYHESPDPPSLTSAQLPRVTFALDLNQTENESNTDSVPKKRRKSSHIRQDAYWIDPSKRRADPSLEISITVDEAVNNTADPTIEDHEDSLSKISTGTMVMTPDELADGEEVKTSSPNSSESGSAVSPEDPTAEMLSFEERNTIRLKKARRAKRKNQCILVLQFLLMIIVFSASIVGTILKMSCSGVTMDPRVFCVVAGITSLVIFGIGANAWFKRTQREFREPKKKPKNGLEWAADAAKPKVKKTPCAQYTDCAICFTFWNILLALFGVYEYVVEMDWQCRLQPVSIAMMLWSCSQVYL